MHKLSMYQSRIYHKEHAIDTIIYKSLGMRMASIYLAINSIITIILDACTVALRS